MSNNTTSTCGLFNGDMEKCGTIIILKRVTGTLSLVGCLFMISAIWLFRKYNILSQRLILYLSIAALFDAIGYLLGDMTPDGPTCDFEAWWLTYFGWTVLMWVSCITFNLYLNVVRHKRTENLEKYYHFLCWFVPPLLLSLLPLAGNNYGPAGAWCWIKHDSIVWRFVIWYIPVFIVIFALFMVYSYIIIFLKRQLTTSSWHGNFNQDSERNNALIEEDIKVLKAYPFVYLVLSIFPLILRIHNAATEEGDDVYVLWVLTVLTAPLQGALNAVVFGFDPETRKKLNWNHIQLAWANRFGPSAVQEYLTSPSDTTDATAGNSEVGIENETIHRQGSLDRYSSYSSLN